MKRFTRRGWQAIATGAACVLTTTLGLPAPSRAADLVPITQRAIAAVTLDHAPATTTSRQAMWTGPHHPSGMLGADLRYHGDGEYDGDLLRTWISPLTRDLACHGARHCAELVTGPERVILRWDLVAVEEDPGVVVVTAEHDGDYTGVLYAGPDITKDPRRLSLEIPVSTMVAIATDPRLRLMTTQDVVDAGAALPDWLGGEPDPHAYDRVPQTDLGQIGGMLLRLGGYASYHDARVSPLKAMFGPDAVGGRVDRRDVADVDPSTIDVLAAPTVPAWLTSSPCRTGRFARHCVRTESRRGPVFMMWRPARGSDPGAVWGIQLRPHAVVAIRVVGGAVPRRAADVGVLVDWPIAVAIPLKSHLVGMTTQKRVLDFDLSQIGGSSS